MTPQVQKKVVDLGQEVHAEVVAEMIGILNIKVVDHVHALIADADIKDTEVKDLGRREIETEKEEETGTDPETEKIGVIEMVPAQEETEKGRETETEIDMRDMREVGIEIGTEIPEKHILMKNKI